MGDGCGREKREIGRKTRDTQLGPLMSAVTRRFRLLSNLRHANSNPASR
jgi:hypothetical protein